MNIIDAVYEAFSPQKAARRMAARVALNKLREYEGASRGTRRTDKWVTRGTSSNAELRKALPILRDRARDLVRNNPYATRAVNVIAGAIVGYGIKTTLRTTNKRNQKPLQDAFTAWFESTDCDIEGNHDGYGLQDVAARALAESGEVLLRRVWVRRKNPRDIPIALQVLEADYIDTRQDSVTVGGNRVIQGKEYDANGRCVAYYLFDDHPGDAFSLAQTRYTSKRVSADDITHLFRMDRPGQGRGVTWFAPVILRLRDLDEYEDAQLIRQKIAACFTVFIGNADGGAEQTNLNKDAEDLIDRLEPGLIQPLPTGMSATLASPPGVQGYQEYMSVSVHAVAAGLSVPYEALTGDYSGVNFTSGKIGFGQFYTIADTWQWKTFIPKFCGNTVRWFKEAAMLAGYNTDGVTAKYTPPHRPMLDPTREVPAIIKAVRGGLMTQPEAIRAQGQDPDEFLEESKEWNAKADAAGIVLDSDPRKITNGGQAQANSPPDDDDPNGDGSGTKNNNSNGDV
ncbi:phage portal protein [Bradyrhizobium sp.]|uniref:phage portal protein n=1 Tax=Bradyrhizobium sp. TaxID=376 RepID=UPI0039E36479